jgi:2-dehydropantoate 2-reductase
MTRAGDDDVDARDSAREETTSAGRAPSRVLVVGGGRVGAYLARAFRRGEVERVALKTSNRAARAGDETREAARAIASDAGAIVMSTYDGLTTEEERHFDFIFIAVKTYALEAVKRELSEAGITFDNVVLAHNGIVAPMFDENKSTRAVMPQSWDIVETPGVGCGYDIHVKNEDKPWVMPNTAGGRATRALLQKCGVLSDATDEFEYLLLRKYFINGVANLLAIVGDCNCDGLLQHHRETMETLYDEMLEILRVPHADGFALAPENFRDVVFAGLATYRDHFPSTKLDFDAGAKLEIDSLNGYVVQRAKEQGLPCAAHERLIEQVNALVAARDGKS